MDVCPPLSNRLNDPLYRKIHSAPYISVVKHWFPSCWGWICLKKRPPSYFDFAADDLCPYGSFIKFEMY